MFVPSDSSVSSHLRFDLESKSISKWISWEVNTFLIDVPGLVQSIVALPVDNMSVVAVVVSMNIKARSRN